MRINLSQRDILSGLHRRRNRGCSAGGKALMATAESSAPAPPEAFSAGGNDRRPDIRPGRFHALLLGGGGGKPSKILSGSPLTAAATANAYVESRPSNGGDEDVWRPCGCASSNFDEEQMTATVSSLSSETSLLNASVSEVEFGGDTGRKNSLAEMLCALSDEDDPLARRALAVLGSPAYARTAPTASPHVTLGEGVGVDSSEIRAGTEQGWGQYLQIPRSVGSGPVNIRHLHFRKPVILRRNVYSC